MPINYQNSKIYVIRSHQTEKIYIGSTVNELRIRLHDHKSKYKNYLKNNYHYISSFEIIKYDDCYIELYEKYSCNDKNELKKREGEIIRSLDCVNKYIAGRKYKEYYQDTKKKKKEYYQENKEKIKQITKNIYQKNKEEILKHKKEYYQENKEQINKKYICSCGSKIIFRQKLRHEKSKKHINFINN